MEGNVPYLLLIGILGMLLLAIAIIAFFLVYQRRIMSQQDDMNHREQEHQRELLNSTLEAQEEERKRIAQDLHDSVGSQLSAAKLYLGQLPGEGKGRVPEIKLEARALIDATIGNVRNISQNLLPPNLESFGLCAAMEDLCAMLKKSEALEVQFEHGDISRLDTQKDVALYRIVQELVNNTLKHAEASTIKMGLQQQNGTLSLNYQDNGKGFNYLKKKEGKQKSLGMHGIESRAQLIGADWKLDSAPGKGFKLEIHLPM